MASVKMNGKVVQSQIKTHRVKGNKERRQWDEYRAWYVAEHFHRGEDVPSGGGDVSDEDDINLETNYPYAFIDTMIANICPTNPQVTVLARKADNRRAAMFREALINENLREEKSHQKLWKLATNTALCGRGILKAVWDFTKNRPCYSVVDPRNFFYDRSVPWEESRYAIEVTVLTRSQFEKRVKKQGKKGAQYNSKVADKAVFGSYPKWLQDAKRDKSMVHAASLEVYQWVTVYEYFDFEEGTYSHWLEDIEEPLFAGKLPYRFLERPYTILTFNDNMTDSGGIPDIKLIAAPNERLNEIDTLELWHAHTSISVLLVNAGMVDNVEDFMSALMQATRPGSAVRLEGKGQAPLRDLIGQTPTPQFSPSFDKMRERCTHIIEFTLGIPAYSRGRVGVADVATEVALADTATRTRNGRRIKAVQDVVKWMSQATFALYEEFLTDETVFVRVIDSTELLEMNRDTLAMRDPATSKGLGFDYDYDSLPYSPTENHRLLQLEKIQQYYPILAQSKKVDQDKLMSKVLELLQISDVEVPESEMAPPTQPGAPVDASSPPMGQGDTIATGALPPGTEPPPIPTPGGGPGAGFSGAAAGLKAGMGQAGVQ